MDLRIAFLISLRISNGPHLNSFAVLVSVSPLVINEVISSVFTFIEDSDSVLFKG